MIRSATGPTNLTHFSMAPPTLSPKIQRLALINVCLGKFMTALDSRSVIVALPTISIYFDTSLAVVQWIPLAYQLTIIGLVLSLARLGDMLGRKKIYGSGFLLLALGSACCGLSTGLWQLIAFRVLQVSAVPWFWPTGERWFRPCMPTKAGAEPSV